MTITDFLGTGLTTLIITLGVNSQALAPASVIGESYSRAGTLRPAGAPRTDAPASFITRVRHRERYALASSLLIALLTAFCAAYAGAPSVQWLGFYGAAGAVTGRAVAIALVSGREAYAESRSIGPRVSRGRVTTLADVLPRLRWVALSVLAVAFLAAFVPQAVRLQPDQQGFLLATTGLALASLAAGWGMASWLARQPVVAGSESELGWTDALRRRDVRALLMLGPVWAFGVTAAAYTYGNGPTGVPVEPLALLAWGFGAALALFGVAVAIADRHTKASR